MKTIAEATTKTPQITLSKAEGVVDITGKSYPEDLHSFWGPATEEILTAAKASHEFKLRFELAYHNSGTTRVILNLIKSCEELASEGRDMSIEWRYDPDDEQVEEQGEDYADMCTEVHFEMVEI